MSIVSPEPKPDPATTGLNIPGKGSDAARDTHGKTVRRQMATGFFQGQLWFIAKNVIGWLMIITSPAIGFLPGPGGIVWFLVGFALATIPGKRSITTSFMRGRQVRLDVPILIGLATLISITVVGGVIVFLNWKFPWIADWARTAHFSPSRKVGLFGGIVLLAVSVSWLVTRFALFMTNLTLRGVPLARRYARPWLRKRGVSLLPPRKRFVDNQTLDVNNNEILEFSQANQDRVVAWGKWFVVWARRALIIGLTLYLFVRVISPIVNSWSATWRQLGRISVLEFLVSVVLFSIMLGAFRAMSWRSIIKNFGNPIPRPAALRIWITSEMARYIPGAIWQVVSRVRMAKAYGVRGSVTSTSQIMELAVFLLANVMIAAACLSILGIQRMDGLARTNMIIALCLVPTLIIVLHPRVFYGSADKILRKLGKPPIAKRMRKRRLWRLLVVSLLGLLVQSIAIWILLRGPFELKFTDLWIVAGSYCLAWTAGFIAIWAPGGAGVRELVLVAILTIALPSALVNEIGKDNAATLQAVSILLRLWTILAEVLIFVTAQILDWKREGRVTLSETIPDT